MPAVSGAHGGAARVFISYRRSDGEQAEKIRRWLNVRGVATFFDKANLEKGHPWVTTLESEIASCRAAVILVGPSGFGNTQQYERDLAITRRTRDASFRVIPVLLPGVTDPPVGFLELFTRIDFSRASDVLEDIGQLQALLAAINDGAQAAGAATEICPYRGLEPFREEDAPFFFGRSEATRELFEKASNYSFVAVIGRSGSGKSSLVFAGLLPLLRKNRSQYWDVITIWPGRDPLTSLAQAFNPREERQASAEYSEVIGAEAERLRAGSVSVLAGMIRQRLSGREGRPDKLLIYVDQWEELYAQSTGGEGKETARRINDVQKFVDLLSSAGTIAPVVVVATIRADFYHHLLRNLRLSSLLPSQQVNLGPIKRNELRDVIVEPARKVGLCFSPPSLVDRILDEVGEDEAMLPLLQYALKETWALREGDQLTADSYETCGGVRKAIRHTADQAFNDLSDDQKKAARRLFLRLVTPGEGQEDTRARAKMPDDAIERHVLDIFAGRRTRLLVTGAGGAKDEATVEVAHEALIRNWPTLRQWVDQNRDRLRARKAVLGLKTEWETNGQREDLLIPFGFQLERARELEKDPREVPVEDIRDFIKLSSEREARERQVEINEAQERTRIAEEKKRLAFYLVGALAAGIIGAGSLAIKASNEEETARRQRDITIEAANTLVQAVTKKIGNVTGFASARAIEVIKSANTVISSLGSDTADEKLLLIKASAHEEFAKAFFNLSDPDTARASQEEAIRAYSALSSASTSPATAEYYRLRSIELTADKYAGQIGDQKTAEKNGRRALGLYRDIIGKAAEYSRIDLYFQIRLTRKLGSLLLKMAEYQGADSLLEANALISRGAELVPTDSQPNIERALLLLLSGDAARNLRNPEESIRNYRSAAQEMSRLRDIEPYNDEYSLIYGEIHQKLGDVYVLRGESRSARDAYELANKILGGLLDTNPGHQAARLLNSLAEEGLRFVGAQGKREQQKDEIIHALFGTGVEGFHFGMAPEEVGKLIGIPVERPTDLTVAWEYGTGNKVRYLWNWMKKIPAFGRFHRGIPCLKERGYVTFLFHEDRLFEVSVRFMASDNCNERKEIMDKFADEFGIQVISTPSERRFRRVADTVAIQGKTTSYAIYIDFTAR